MSARKSRSTALPTSSHSRSLITNLSRKPGEDQPASAGDLVQKDRLLSDQDVASRYGVARQTIWRWLRASDKFPKPFKIGGTTRWSERELDEHDRKLKEARQ